MEQGQQGRGFYMLKSGSVEVYKDDLLLSILEFPGTIFGEMADITGKQRSCRIQARTKCRLIHIDETNIERLIQDRPEIAIRIMKTLASRLERTTQKLAEQFQEPPVWTVDPNEN